MPSAAPKTVFYDTADGRRLAARVWEPQAAPLARAVFLHGVVSHGGWYGECATHLAAMGLEVHYLDRRGSGLNAEQPGDIDRWQTLVDDVARYIDHCNAEKLGADRLCGTVLCGISWGGKLAVAVARRHPAKVNALTLICPGIYSPYSPNFFKRLVLSLPLPARFLQRRVPIPLQDSSLFTDSPQRRAFIDRDPITLRKVTWRFAQQDCELTRYAQQSASYLYMPVLLVLAGEDRIIDNRRTRDYFGRVQSRKKLLIEYSHAGHTLEFELDPTMYFNDLGEWIRELSGRDCSSGFALPASNVELR
jgi:alpha-beta hydrolase superfamily lysophospholipase